MIYCFMQIIITNYYKATQKMSLFIGNIPNEQDATEFEELFSNIGSC